MPKDSASLAKDRSGEIAQACSTQIENLESARTIGLLSSANEDLHWLAQNLFHRRLIGTGENTDEDLRVFYTEATSNSELPWLILNVKLRSEESQQYIQDNVGKDREKAIQKLTNAQYFRYRLMADASNVVVFFANDWSWHEQAAMTLVSKQVRAAAFVAVHWLKPREQKDQKHLFRNQIQSYYRFSDDVDDDRLRY
jgi:hypothetical protein